MKRFTSIFVLLLAVITLSAQDITGTWKGKLSFTDQMGNPAELGIVFHISATDNGYSSTMDSPDQGGFDIPADTTIFKDSEVTIKKAEYDVVYVGKLVDDTSLEGTLTQYGGSLDLNLKKETE
jgi:hypothetical protein